jgi:hypothetical protein
LLNRIVHYALGARCRWSHVTTYTQAGIHHSCTCIHVLVQYIHTCACMTSHDMVESFD